MSYIQNCRFVIIIIIIYIFLFWIWDRNRLQMILRWLQFVLKKFLNFIWCATHLADLMDKNWCHCRGKTWCVFHAVPIRTHLKQARYWTLQWLNKLLCIDCVIMKINAEFRLCMKGPGRIVSWSRVHFYTSKYSLSLYFADFYCMAIHCRYERYRVTLVICQKGTVLLPCHVRRLEWLINPEKYKGSPYTVAWERCVFFFIYFFIIIYMVWTLINWYFYSYRLLRITSLRT